MNYSGKRIVIVGATSAMAERCARIWVEGGASHITLIGRNQNKLEKIADDLRVRGSCLETDIYTPSFADPVAIDALVASISAKGKLDLVLIAHGNLPDQQACQQDLSACDQALLINGTSPVLFAEAFIKRMEPIDTGTLALIGSVAGDRGRKSNYIYGAAKGLVTRYAQGLQHRLANSGVKVVLIKPGPTDTPMTSELKSDGAKLASVDAVAQAIVVGVDKGMPVVYAPVKWGGIMMIIRHLPRFIFNKLDI